MTETYGGPNLGTQCALRVIATYSDPFGDGRIAFMSNSELSIHARFSPELLKENDEVLHDDACLALTGKLVNACVSVGEPDEIIINVASFRPVQATIDTLPVYLCNDGHQEPLRRLVALVNDFVPPVRRFVEICLNSRDQYQRFLTVPASRQCHHTERGGLLLHSLEVVELLQQNPVIRDIENDGRRHLILALGLLHDIGKCYSAPDFDGGALREHNELTIKAIDLGIAWLRHAWPAAEDYVKYLFNTAMKQTCPSSPEALAIQFADRTSASLDARRKAFDNMPDSLLRAHVTYSSGHERYFQRAPAFEG